jgi:hypothetical protein
MGNEVATQERRSGFGSGFFFARRNCPQRGIIDSDGDAVMFETVQEGINEALSLEDVVPFGIIQVGCQNRGLLSIMFPHQFE